MKYVVGWLLLIYRSIDLNERNVIEKKKKKKESVTSRGVDNNYWKFSWHSISTNYFKKCKDRVQALIFDWHMTGFNVVAYWAHMLARTFTRDPGHCLTLLCVFFLSIWLLLLSFHSTRCRFFFLCSNIYNSIEKKKKTNEIYKSIHSNLFHCVFVIVFVAAICFSGMLGLFFFLNVCRLFNFSQNKRSLLKYVRKYSICIQCMFHFFFFKIDVVHFITKFLVYTMATNGYNSLANKYLVFIYFILL